MKLPIPRGAFPDTARRSGSGPRKLLGLKGPGAYLLSAGVVLAMVGLAMLLHRFLPHANLSLLFLTGVLIISATTGPGPSLLAGLLSFLAFNFLLTPPYYTLEVADEGDLATLGFFLLMAAVTGHLAATMRRESTGRKAALERISKLYEFSNQAASLVSGDEILRALREHLVRCLDRPVLIVRDPADDDAEILGAESAHCVPSRQDLEQAWLRIGDAPVEEGGFVFLGLVVDNFRFAMAAFAGPAEPEQVEIAKSLCEQASLALDRTRLSEELEASRLVSETEQLRSALLSSVSHDLRTPLAAIIGSSSSLQEYGASFSDEDREELLCTVVGEARRLDRYIQNLLDMTRLGQGTLSLCRDWVDVSDLVASAVGRLDVEHSGITIDTQIDEDVPLLHIHGALIEQALFNLLDNAVRFSPPAGRVAVHVCSGDGQVELRVNDEGPGIPASERERVFDMFYTVRKGDRGSMPGTGLGLAICRGMAGAHGGTVVATDGPDGKGTSMRICLPLDVAGNTVET